ncbi:MAG TPA: transglycosylase SLT domain-containing protein, partial [Candidatus Acidoferrales bacterium]
MIRRAIFALCAVAAAGAVAAPAARADYAVLKSGLRLHITGFERTGDVIRLTIFGGEVTIPAGDLVAVEPEDFFEALPAAKSAPQVPFGNLIHAAAAKHGLDENLLALVIAQESNFDPKAVSRRKARGLMQLMPQTAAQLEVKNTLDPAQNIDAGARYLRELLDRYAG